jgi:hypothetical protein
MKKTMLEKCTYKIKFVTNITSNIKCESLFIESR